MLSIRRPRSVASGQLADSLGRSGGYRERPELVVTGSGLDGRDQQLGVIGREIERLQVRDRPRHQRAVGFGQRYFGNDTLRGRDFGDIELRVGGEQVRLAESIVRDLSDGSDFRCGHRRRSAGADGKHASHDYKSDDCHQRQKQRNPAGYDFLSRSAHVRMLATRYCCQAQELQTGITTVTSGSHGGDPSHDSMLKRPPRRAQRFTKADHKATSEPGTIAQPESRVLLCRDSSQRRHTWPTSRTTTITHILTRQVACPRAATLFHPCSRQPFSPRGPWGRLGRPPTWLSAFGKCRRTMNRKDWRSPFGESPLTGRLLPACLKSARAAYRPSLCGTLPSDSSRP